MAQMKSKLGNIVFLQAVLFLYSLAAVCSKLASKQSFLSAPFILWYGLALVILIVYALLWQQVLKRNSLTAAYANKAVTVIWGLVWGVLLFDEKITPFMLLGMLVIIAGILLVVSDDG